MKAMNNEYETYADIEGDRIPCSVSYEVESNGYKPLVYGIFALDDYDTDITARVPEDEFDRIYGELCQVVAENILGE